jgi:hypothetical protein
MIIDEEFIDYLASFIDKVQKTPRPHQNSSSLPVRMKARMTKERISDVDREIKRTITGIEKLPYVRFTGRTNESMLYFVGITKQVAIFTGKRFENLGQYIVYIPVYSVMNARLEHFHFVRMKHPFDHNRHYHHVCTGTSKFRNPITLAPSTCWGSVGAMMIGAMETVDIVSVFETAYVFLTHVNISDSLGEPAPIDVIDENTFCQLRGLSRLQLFNVIDKSNPF